MLSSATASLPATDTLERVKADTEGRDVPVMAEMLDSYPGETTLQNDPAPSSNDDDWQDYQPLSLLAVGSVVVAVLGLLTFIEPLIGVVPLIAGGLACFALRSISQSNGEMRGGVYAMLGLGLAAVGLVGGLGYHVYVYATEVPTGFVRLNFADLQPDERNPQGWYENLKSWDGKDVFLKGFIYPGEKKQGLTAFLLCRDKGDCCFGGNPKITDRVLVLLDGKEGINFSEFLQKFTGTFKLSNQKAVDASGEVLYVLEAAEKR
ncbi:MAG: hypothetical protein SFX18_02070 [Pirellulales bacterium]|nr:hypothetical protein [Pirellulales bacterium]